ncbi:hypothetical protein GALL_299390 [mine drainage metagenome]|uniref:Uncharacterized protein n=1 Tax=mine drainage metagenome TaxID=410659 RepID=A0A1J5R7Z7_9ZZZZ
MPAPKKYLKILLSYNKKGNFPDFIGRHSSSQIAVRHNALIYRLIVTSISTEMAMIPVASQPSTFIRRLTMKRPMIPG